MNITPVIYLNYTFEDVENKIINENTKSIINEFQKKLFINVTTYGE